jgi:hypothetical protein
MKLRSESESVMEDEMSEGKEMGNAVGSGFTSDTKWAEVF